MCGVMLRSFRLWIVLGAGLGLIPALAFGEPLDRAALEALGEGDTPAERIASGLRRAVAGLSP